MRLGTVIVVVAVVAIGGYAGYHYIVEPKKEQKAAGQQQAPAAVTVEATQVRSDRLEVVLSTVGSLKANESLELRPEIAGRIDTIHFTEGAPAKKGDLLVSIDDRVYAAELKQAEAQANLARTNYTRAKLLKEKGAGTVSNYDNMQAALSVAQAQVDLAKARLDKTRITAPFDGVMGLRHVSPGDYVNIGQDIVGFQSKNPMKAEFTLPENAMRVLAVGQNIDLKVDAMPERTFTGNVYAIDPQINEMSRNVTLRAFVPNEDLTLNPGMFARINIITQQKDNALFLPEAAIIPRGNDNYVMKIGADNKVTSVPVVIGERRNGEVEIVSGVAAGDIAVTAGQIKLRDGQEAKYTLHPGGAPAQSEAQP